MILTKKGTNLNMRIIITSGLILLCILHVSCQSGLNTGVRKMDYVETIVLRNDGESEIVVRDIFAEGIIHYKADCETSISHSVLHIRTDKESYIFIRDGGAEYLDGINVKAYDRRIQPHKKIRFHFELGESCQISSDTFLKSHFRMLIGNDCYSLIYVGRNEFNISLCEPE